MFALITYALLVGVTKTEFLWVNVILEGIKAGFHLQTQEIQVEDCRNVSDLENICSYAAAFQQVYK